MMFGYRWAHEKLAADGGLNLIADCGLTAESGLIADYGLNTVEIKGASWVGSSDRAHAGS